MFSRQGTAEEQQERTACLCACNGQGGVLSKGSSSHEATKRVQQWQLNAWQQMLNLKFGLYVLSALLQNAQHLQPFIFRHDAHARRDQSCFLGGLLLSMLPC